MREDLAGDQASLHGKTGAQQDESPRNETADTPRHATHGPAKRGNVNPNLFVGQHRLEALTDGVYAIAITLLVLELKLPRESSPAGTAELHRALLCPVPHVLVWLLSFCVTAVFWLGQQRVHRALTALDRLGVRIELAQLAFTRASRLLERVRA